jgi:CRISPR-associated protein Cmr5
MPPDPSPVAEPPRRFTKDQERARRAYRQVQRLWNACADARRAGDKAAEATARKACDEYDTAVKALGANILRSGLAAAVAELMRRKADTLREHLANSAIPGFAPETAANNLLVQANNLRLREYMLATRETLQVVMWLKRACEAIFEDAPDAGPASAPAGGDHAQ